MNPVYRAAAESAELGWLMGGTTVVFLLCFVGWTVYAFAPGNKKHHEEAARIPFDGGEA